MKPTREQILFIYGLAVTSLQPHTTTSAHKNGRTKARFSEIRWVNRGCPGQMFEAHEWSCTGPWTYCYIFCFEARWFSYREAKEYRNCEHCLNILTWEDLAAAHRALIPGPSSPSGLPNRYATVPYAFPAAVQLTGLGAISDALVGRRRWDSPEVREELNQLFSPDISVGRRFIVKWRESALERAHQCLDKVFRFERDAFQEHSAWAGNDSEDGDESDPAPDEASVASDRSLLTGIILTWGIYMVENDHFHLRNTRRTRVLSSIIMTWTTLSMEDDEQNLPPKFLFCCLTDAGYLTTRSYIISHNYECAY
ncbi:hypothetical protein BDV25DRAFT_137298 [Aspergillus avenaceus]|uniref:Uncharacterized protein n=1 Tax=Aspergillus avenaceus TaxID=36643 RepID=A0A5N6U339_ASPAV|nr:hypothetical protein BDV25DRAFT_137298 [Aspergillus avenaceus]